VLGIAESLGSNSSTYSGMCVLISIVWALYSGPCRISAHSHALSFVVPKTPSCPWARWRRLPRSAVGSIEWSMRRCSAPGRRERRWKISRPPWASPRKRSTTGCEMVTGIPRSGAADRRTPPPNRDGSELPRLGRLQVARRRALRSTSCSRSIGRALGSHKTPQRKAPSARFPAALACVDHRNARDLPHHMAALPCLLLPRAEPGTKRGPVVRVTGA
jgi:hypothetical protein